MSDRELLELAAKAAGLHPARWSEKHQCIETLFPDDLAAGRTHWNPLEDDGDALRLAVKMCIGAHPKGPMHWHEPNTTVAIFDLPSGSGGRVTVPHGADPATATRRAIVRAAAEIGKAMP